MTAGHGDGDARRAEPAADDEAARRRRRQAVFGDVLPEITADERDDAARDSGPREPGESGNDAWLRSNVPPHHG